MPWCQASSWKTKAVVFENVMTDAYSKVCEIFIEYFKYVRELYTHLSVIVVTFPRPEMWRSEVGSYELHLLRYIYLSQFLGK